MELILASKSPRRQELLSGIGAKYRVVVPDCRELTSAADLHTLPLQNARLKAECVSLSYPEALVLGADTLVLLENESLGKPADLLQAAAFLRRLSGKTHEVLTGVVLCCAADGFREEYVEVSYVKFRELTEGVIAKYLASVPVLDKAGAYALQEHGEMLVDYFIGEQSNIIGLPLKRLKRLLADRGVLS